MDAVATDCVQCLVILGLREIGTAGFLTSFSQVPHFEGLRFLIVNHVPEKTDSPTFPRAVCPHHRSLRVFVCHVGSETDSPTVTNKHSVHKQLCAGTDTERTHCFRSERSQNIFGASGIAR